jgi:hypothetical protein
LRKPTAALRAASYRRADTRRKEACMATTTITPSLVQQYAAMAPSEFGASVHPRWKVAERLVNYVRDAVEKEQLTPLDGARLISSITATLFGYDEFILREISPETLLASPLGDTAKR